jgi:predicted nucleic acid-binding protein
MIVDTDGILEAIADAHAATAQEARALLAQSQSRGIEAPMVEAIAAAHALTAIEARAMIDAQRDAREA